jgi:uncharacterized protein YqgV (UPF0045/DUF77 family)
MNVTCQFAIYPLGVEALGPPLEAALAAVRRHRLEPEVGPMSSTVSGELKTVLAALGDAFEAAAGGDCVMVASLSNAC